MQWWRPADAWHRLLHGGSEEHNSTAMLPAPELLCKTVLLFLPLLLLPYPKA